MVNEKGTIINDIVLFKNTDCHQDSKNRIVSKDGLEIFCLISSELWIKVNLFCHLTFPMINPKIKCNLIHTSVEFLKTKIWSYGQSRVGSEVSNIQNKNKTSFSAIIAEEYCASLSLGLELLKGSKCSLDFDSSTLAFPIFNISVKLKTYVTIILPIIIGHSMWIVFLARTDIRLRKLRQRTNVKDDQLAWTKFQDVPELKDGNDIDIKKNQERWRK